MFATEFQFNRKTLVYQWGQSGLKCRTPLYREYKLKALKERIPLKDELLQLDIVETQVDYALKDFDNGHSVAFQNVLNRINWTLITGEVSYYSVEVFYEPHPYYPGERKLGFIVKVRADESQNLLYRVFYEFPRHVWLYDDSLEMWDLLGTDRELLGEEVWAEFQAM